MSTWFAFDGYDTINVAGVQEKTLVAIGFHGYNTKQAAEKAPNSVSLWQKPSVNLAEIDYKAAVKSGEQPGGPHATLTPGNVVAGGVQSNLGSFSGALSAFEALVGAITDGTMWRSLGWLVIGLILTFLGVALYLRNKGILPEVIPI